MLNMDSYIPFEQLGFLYLKTGQFFLADEMLYESDLRKGLQIPDEQYVDSQSLRSPVFDSDSDGVSNYYDFFREDLYLKLIELNPNDIDSYLILADYYYKNGRWAESEYMYRQVIALDPDHKRAHERLFLLMEKKGHFAGMELFLDILDRLVPGEFLSQRLALYERWERYVAREPLLRKNDLLYALDQHFTQESRFTNLRWLASESYSENRDFASFEKEVRDLRNEDIHELDYIFYSGLLEMGLPAYLPVPEMEPLSDWSGMESAHNSFLRIVERDYPASTQAYYWLGDLERNMTTYFEHYQKPYRKELSHQEQYLLNATKALEGNPANLDFRIAYISALLKNWKYEEALGQLDSLDTDYMLDAEWITRFAKLKLLSGERAEAEEAMDRVKYAFIHEEEAPDAWFRTKGLWAQFSDQHVEAEEAFNTLVRRHYESEEDYYQQCRSLVEMGELERALSVLEVAWINGFRYDRVFKYDPHLRVLKEWDRFENWKGEHAIDWDRYRRQTRYN